MLTDTWRAKNQAMVNIFTKHCVMMITQKAAP